MTREELAEALKEVPRELPLLIDRQTRPSWRRYTKSGRTVGHYKTPGEHPTRVVDLAINFQRNRTADQIVIKDTFVRITTRPMTEDEIKANWKIVYDEADKRLEAIGRKRLDDEERLDDAVEAVTGVRPTRDELATTTT